MIEACGRIEKEGLKRSRLFVGFAPRFEGCFLSICLLPFSYLLSPHINFMSPKSRSISISFDYSCLLSDNHSPARANLSTDIMPFVSLKIHNENYLDYPYVVHGASSGIISTLGWDYSCLVRIETDTGLVGWHQKFSS